VEKKGDRITACRKYMRLLMGFSKKKAIIPNFKRNVKSEPQLISNPQK
jgi:hypothetical protein